MRASSTTWSAASTGESDASKQELEELHGGVPLSRLWRPRLRPEVLAVTVGGKSIYEFLRAADPGELAFLDSLT